MKDVAELIQAGETEGIRFSVEGDNLKLDGTRNEHGRFIEQHIKPRKEEIIRYLNGESGEAEVVENDKPKDDRQDAKWVDPETEAKNVLDSHKHRGFNKLIFWCGGFLYWSDGKFVPIPTSEARTLLVKSLNERFTGVGTSVVSDVLEQVRAAALLSIQVQPPSWLSPNIWKPEDVVATENSIVHLPTFIQGNTAYSIPSTPALFTTCALDYKFDDSKPDCPNWKAFIRQLWENDQDCINTLQEWFGYPRSTIAGLSRLDRRPIIVPIQSFSTGEPTR